MRRCRRGRAEMLLASLKHHSNLTSLFLHWLLHPSSVSIRSDVLGLGLFCSKTWRFSYFLMATVW